MQRSNTIHYDSSLSGTKDMRDTYNKKNLLRTNGENLCVPKLNLNSQTIHHKNYDSQVAESYLNDTSHEDLHDSDSGRKRYSYSEVEIAVPAHAESPKIINGPPIMTQKPKVDRQKHNAESKRHLDGSLSAKENECSVNGGSCVCVKCPNCNHNFNLPMDSSNTTLHDNKTGNGADYDSDLNDYFTRLFLKDEINRRYENPTSQTAHRPISVSTLIKAFSKKSDTKSDNEKNQSNVNEDLNGQRNGKFNFGNNFSVPVSHLKNEAEKNTTNRLNNNNHNNGKEEKAQQETNGCVDTNPMNFMSPPMNQCGPAMNGNFMSNMMPSYPLVQNMPWCDTSMMNNGNPHQQNCANHRSNSYISPPNIFSMNDFQQGSNSPARNNSNVNRNFSNNNMMPMNYSYLNSNGMNYV